MKLQFQVQERKTIRRSSVLQFTLLLLFKTVTSAILAQ